jgi:Ca-activated chloride channel family protein
MRFLQPHQAVWLLAIPVIWIASLLHRWYRERTRHASGLGDRLGSLAPLTGLGRDIALLTLTSVAAVSLVFAAARPQLPTRTPEYESRDLLLLLDRSASMQAEDIRPTRFQRATLEIRNFLKNKPDAIARVGLIGFAGSSLTLSRETRDSGILLFYLDWIEGDHEPLFGTNMAGALESAFELAGKDAPDRRKFVVIISDGEDESGSLEPTVAKFAAGRIPIYAIGIGSNSEVPIPTEVAGVRDVLRDDHGLPLTTRFTEGTLRWIAGATGGRYFRSTTGAELGTALTDIARREQRIVGWRTDELRELYPWGLATAAFALGWSLVLL